MEKSKKEETAEKNEGIIEKKEETANVENPERAEGGIFGELPEKESEVIKSFLKQKWNNVFEAYICKKDEAVPLYDQRISVAVYIKEK